MSSATAPAAALRTSPCLLLLLLLLLLFCSTLSFTFACRVSPVYFFVVLHAFRNVFYVSLCRLPFSPPPRHSSCLRDLFYFVLICRHTLARVSVLVIRSVYTASCSTLTIRVMARGSFALRLRSGVAWRGASETERSVARGDGVGLRLTLAKHS